MKISKKTNTELVLEEKTGLNIFLFIWSIFFAGIPLIILISLFSALGVITINCQRIEPQLVNCRLNRSQFGDFFAGDSKILNNVIKVEFQQIEGIDSDNETTIDNRIILLGKNGENLVVEELMFINGVRGNEKLMREITIKINNFLNSNESFITTKIDNRWRWSNLFIFCFVSIFIIIGSIAFIYTILEIGYRTIILDKVSRNLHFTKVNLLGTKVEKFSLSTIPYIFIKSLTDSDNDQYYLLFIPISNNLEKYQIDREIKLDKIENKAQEIATFLDIKVIKK